MEKIRQGGFQSQLLSFNVECAVRAAVNPATGRNSCISVMLISYFRIISSTCIKLKFRPCLITPPTSPSPQAFSFMKRKESFVNLFFFRKYFKWQKAMLGKMLRFRTLIGRFKTFLVLSFMSNRQGLQIKNNTFK